MFFTFHQIFNIVCPVFFRWIWMNRLYSNWIRIILIWRWHSFHTSWGNSKIASNSLGILCSVQCGLITTIWMTSYIELLWQITLCRHDSKQIVMPFYNEVLCFFMCSQATAIFSFKYSGICSKTWVVIKDESIVFKEWLHHFIVDTATREVAMGNNECFSLFQVTCSICLGL